MKAKILELIDRIIGKKGMLWIPAYWMRNILSQILDWVEGVDAGLRREVAGVDSRLSQEITGIDDRLSQEIATLKDLTQGATFRFTCTNSVDMTDELDVTRTYPSGTHGIKFVRKFPLIKGNRGYISEVAIIGGFQQLTILASSLSNCNALSSINLGNLNSANVTNFSSMFSYCQALTTIPQLDTSAGTDFSSMFSYCTSLTTIPQLDTSKGLNVNAMFRGCSALTSITQLDLSEVAGNLSFYRTFDGCSALTSITLVGSINSTPISFTNSPLNEASIRSVLEACSRTTNSRSKVVAFRVGSTFNDTDGLVAQCTSKGWTVQNLTIS